MLLDTHGSYWRFGPSEDLIIISVKINDYTKYGVLLGLISLINVVKVISQEIGEPILGFNVYNPDKKHIKEFGRLELQVMANTMFMISSIRSMFMVLISISQIDIAFWNVIIQEITSIYTIRMLLNAKTFDEDNVEYSPVEMEIV